MSLVVGSNLKLKQVSATPSETPASGEILLYSNTGDALLTKPADNVERTVRTMHTVKLASTAVLTLSGTQTIDGVSAGVGDRVLVHHNGSFVGGNAFDNGIWVVAAGAWSRAADANTSAKIAGAEVLVTDGVQYGQKIFKTNFLATDTLGTTACKWYVQGAMVEQGGAFALPYQAAPGHAYFDNTNRMFQIWNGVTWAKPKGVQDYSSTAPSSPVAGELWFDTSDVATVIGAWTAYTPTLSNITLGNGTVTARWEQIGKTVRGTIIFAAGSTTTYSAGVLGFSLPVTAQTADPLHLTIGPAYCDNASTATRNVGGAILQSTSVVGAQFGNGVTAATNLVPFTWGVSSHLSISFEYEAA